MPETHIEAKLEGREGTLAVTVRAPFDTVLHEDSWHRPADVQVNAQGDHTPEEAAALAQMLQAAAMLANADNAAYLSYAEHVPFFHPDEHVKVAGIGGRVIDRRWREGDSRWQYRVLYDGNLGGCTPEGWHAEGELELDGLARNYLGAITPKDAYIPAASVKLFGMGTNLDALEQMS